MRIDKRTEQCDRLGSTPGRYLVSRDLTIDGEPYGACIECVNPAFGNRILDTWERETIERLQAAISQRAEA